MIKLRNRISCINMTNIHDFKILEEITQEFTCYDLKLKGLSNKTTLVLSITRELDRVPNTK